MDEYSAETYGERIAGLYDEWYAEFDQDAIQVLVELAHGGPALELGIGTGRFAIPLINRGLSVQGIDVSDAMVSRLKAKPGGEKISVTMGNFCDVNVDGKFALVYVVFNTFFSPLTQAEQVRCFQNVARHLEPEGVFVIEAFVPDLKRFTGGQTMRVVRIGDREVQFDATEHEQEKQLLTSQHVVLGEQGARFFPVKIRYVWPSEMDLMAQLAGLELKERWSDWRKSAFSGDSQKHISIYRHP